MSIGVVGSHYVDSGATGFHAAVAAIAPTVYGKHNEASGTTLTDYSGNGHNGIYSAVTLGAAALLPSETDTSATYNGSTSTGQVPYGAWMDSPTALTVYVVVKKTVASSQIMVCRDGRSSNRIFQMNLGTRFNFVKIDDTGGIVTAASPAAYNDGNVHHLGATYDGASIRLYADGVKVQTTAAAGTLGTATRLIELGMLAGGFQKYAGGMGHWFIKNAVLTDADMATLYAAR